MESIIKIIIMTKNNNSEQYEKLPLHFNKIKNYKFKKNTQYC